MILPLYSIFFETLSAIKNFVNISLILKEHLLIHSENIRIRAKRLLNETKKKMQTYEKSSYLKTDWLHTNLPNKEQNRHIDQKHRRNQQIPQTTKNSFETISRSYRQFRLSTRTRNPDLRYVTNIKCVLKKKIMRDVAYIFENTLPVRSRLKIVNACRLAPPSTLAVLNKHIYTYPMDMSSYIRLG